jgi:hypothetical protein
MQTDEIEREGRGMINGNILKKKQVNRGDFIFHVFREVS